MQGCSDNGQLIGRAKTLELAYGCADQFPAEGDWKLMGLPTSATWDLSPEALTSDATADSVQTLLPVWIRPTPLKGRFALKTALMSLAFSSS